MAGFNIISSDGAVVKATGTPVYNGTFLKPGCLEFQEIGSPVPIDFQAGDYVDYPRTGLRYKLYSTPKVLKQGERNRYGGSFVYENVQFFDMTKELELAPFIDLVPFDNMIHFSTRNAVAFIGTPANVAERIQACLAYWFPSSGWVVDVVSGLDPVADSELIETLSIETEFSVSGISCLEALDRIYETWNGLGWSYSNAGGVNRITIGLPNKRTEENTTDSYGRIDDNGLVTLARSVSNLDQMGTRLYAYGSMRNMPTDYYRSKEIKDAESVDIANLMLPIYGNSFPAGYTRLLYVACDGEQWFDAGFKGTAALNFDVTAMATDSSSLANYGIFGGRTSSGGARYDASIGYSSSDNIALGTVFWGLRSSGYTLRRDSAYGKVRLVKSGSGLTVYNNGVEVGTLSGSSSSFTSGRNITIGAVDNNGSIINPFVGRLYRMTFGSRADLVPAMRNSDSAIGFYDLVRGTFYQSTTGTPFTAGPTDSSEYNGWGLTDGLPDARKAYVEDSEAVERYGLIPKYAYFDGSNSDYPEIYPSIAGATIGDVIDGKAELSDTTYVPSLSKWSRDDRIDEIVSAVNPSDTGGSSATGDKYSESGTFDTTAATAGTLGTDPAEVELGYYSPASSADYLYASLNLTGTATLQDEGDTESGLDIRVAIVVSSPTATTSGDMEVTPVPTETAGEYTFSIEGVTFNLALPNITSVQVIFSIWKTGYGRIDCTANIDAGTVFLGYSSALGKTFKATIPQIGFNIIQQADMGSGKTISMLSGMCAGRDFPIKAATYNPATDSWDLVLGRVKDDDTGLWYPNADFPIESGDKYVLLDIAMPELYISMASARLLREAERLLENISTESPYYEPGIDSKRVRLEGRILREGMWMHLEGDEIVDGGEDYALIDTLRIDEAVSNIPVYEVTLRKRKPIEWTEAISAGSVRPSSTPVEEQQTGGQSAQNLDWFIPETYEEDDVTKRRLKLNPRYEGMYAEGWVSGGGVSGQGGGGGAYSLPDLSDVDDDIYDHITAGQALIWNGTEWTSGNIGGGGVFYGICGTAAGTAAKIVDCQEFTSADIKVGTTINILMRNENTTIHPTLNINNTGAYPVFMGAMTQAASDLAGWWGSYEIVMFTFTGNGWNIGGGKVAATYYNFGQVQLIHNAADLVTYSGETGYYSGDAHCLYQIYQMAQGGSYTLPLAANGTRGGIQIGYSESSLSTNRNYAVKLSGEKAYVTVPWIEYDLSPYATTSSVNTALEEYLKIDGTRAMEGSLRPDTNSDGSSGYNLGTSQFYWKGLYAKRIYLSPNVYIEYDSSNLGVRVYGAGIITDSFITGGGVSTTS